MVAKLRKGSKALTIAYVAYIMDRMEDISPLCKKGKALHAYIDIMDALDDLLSDGDEMREVVEDFVEKTDKFVDEVKNEKVSK